MENVKKSTRASRKGTTIFCPHCNTPFIAASFNWLAAKCNHCNQWSTKTEFLIDRNLPHEANKIRKHLLKILTLKNIETIIERTPKNSIIENVKETLIKMLDCLLVQKTNENLNMLKMSIPDQENVKFKAALMLIKQLYEDEESKDINESRKQKLIRIKNSL